MTGGVQPQGRGWTGERMAATRGRALLSSRSGQSVSSRGTAHQGLCWEARYVQGWCLEHPNMGWLGPSPRLVPSECVWQGPPHREGLAWDPWFHVEEPGHSPLHLLLLHYGSEAGA